MRILIATDAWHPQVNGVVRTLTSLARAAAALGADIEFLTPEGFPSVGVPTYPGLRVALPNRREIARRIEAAAPGRDPYRDRRPDRLGGARLLPPPQARLHHLLHDALSGICRGAHRHSGRGRLCRAAAFSRRRRHDHGRDRLAAAGARRSAASASSASGRAASTPNCSGRTMPATLDLPRPIFMTMGRVAVEKNLEAFLSLDLPGSKVVIGDGPQRARARAALSEREIPRREEGRGPDRASRRRRRLRVPEPHRHVRRGAARSAGLRHAGCGVPGHRPARRDRRSSDRRAG